MNIIFTRPAPKSPKYFFVFVSFYFFHFFFFFFHSARHCNFSISHQFFPYFLSRNKSSKPKILEPLKTTPPSIAKKPSRTKRKNHFTPVLTNTPNNEKTKSDQFTLLYSLSRLKNGCRYFLS